MIAQKGKSGQWEFGPSPLSASRWVRQREADSGERGSHQHRFPQLAADHRELAGVHHLVVRCEQE